MITVGQSSVETQVQVRSNGFMPIRMEIKLVTSPPLSKIGNEAELVTWVRVCTRHHCMTMHITSLLHFSLNSLTDKHPKLHHTNANMPTGQLFRIYYNVILTHKPNKENFQYGNYGKRYNIGIIKNYLISEYAGRKKTKEKLIQISAVEKGKKFNSCSKENQL